MARAEAESMTHTQNGQEEEIEEKVVKYYSSFHQILLVGDGDFSFSLSLALSFGSATNIVASSLDSYDVVIKKYKNARSNLEKLSNLGASLLHGVDATTMKLYTDLRMRKFDRIIYNFPHAGFYGKEDNLHLIGMHRNLVQGFFKNASGMLRANGEVHVNHKTSFPFNNWNLEELASRNSLALIECVDFKIQDYPGYNNKRGDGARCDDPFPLGTCSTFKFRFSPTSKKKKNIDSICVNPKKIQIIQQLPDSVGFAQSSLNPVAVNYIQGYVSSLLSAVMINQCSRIFSGYLNYLMGNLASSCVNPQQSREIPQQPNSVGFTQSSVNPVTYANPAVVDTNNECSRIFQEYFNYVKETFKKPDYSVSYLVETLKLGFERYEAEKPGRPLIDYINLLNKLFTI